MFQQTVFYGGTPKIMLISRENPKCEQLSKTLGQLLAHEDYVSIENCRKKKLTQCLEGLYYFSFYFKIRFIYLFIYATTCHNELPIPDGKHRSGTSVAMKCCTLYVI